VIRGLSNLFENLSIPDDVIQAYIDSLGKARESRPVSKGEILELQGGRYIEKKR
jgi:hypothetical protein